MKRLIAIYVITILVFASTLAFGQLTSTGAGKKASPAAAYSGPGDIVSGATAWYGLRAYSAADRGNRLINVCIPADAACADESSDATTGALVVNSVGGSSCSVVTCTIKTMYDRSGNGKDATQATIGTRPTLSVSCIGSLPCAVCSGSQWISGTIVAVNQPYTFSVVFKRNANVASLDDVFSAFGTVVEFSNTTSSVIISAGSSLGGTATLGSWHALQGVYNGASGDINVNNTRTTGNTGASASGTQLEFCGALGANRFLNGSFAEGGMWPSAFSSGNETSMCHNQFTYWGTSVSC